MTIGAERVPLVSLISVTVAPGMTPPCASWTVPVMKPVVTCADAARVCYQQRHERHQADS